MKLYKLTDQQGMTQNDTRWAEGEKNSIPKDKRRPELCSDGVLHAYKDLDLGLLLNPIHSGFDSPLAWECSGDVAVEDWDKVGCYELTVLKQHPLPGWYVDEAMRRKVQVQFAILCARVVLHIYESEYSSDAPRKAIEAAEEYLRTGTVDAVAAYAAYAHRRALPAGGASAYAAYAAAYAADAAAYAAYAVAAYAPRRALPAGGASAYAAYAAAYAAYAARAARAAVRVARACGEINFAVLAGEAVRMIEEGING